jgi:hypothetical protein
MPVGDEVSMPPVPWIELALFMAGVGFVALYGLTVSGHFPAEFRADNLESGAGATVIWATIIVTSAAAATILIVGWIALPWYAIVIGGGAVLLATPLLLRPFPDWFVDGRAGLWVFAAGALAIALILWAAT